MKTRDVNSFMNVERAGKPDDRPEGGSASGGGGERERERTNHIVTPSQAVSHSDRPRT